MVFVSWPDSELILARPLPCHSWTRPSRTSAWLCYGIDLPEYCGGRATQRIDWQVIFLKQYDIRLLEQCSLIASKDFARLLSIIHAQERVDVGLPFNHGLPSFNHGLPFFNHYISWITIFLKISKAVRIFYTILTRYCSKLIWAGVYVQKDKKHTKFGQF